MAMFNGRTVLFSPNFNVATIQLEEMPTLTAENFEQYRGKIYQYVGNVAGTYHKGYFYMAYMDAESNYSWLRIDVQPHQDISGKLTEPSSGLAVGKTFKIASIDGSGHAVLECVDTTCRQVLIGEVTTTEDVSAAAIDYANGNLLTEFDKLILLVRFPVGGVPSAFTLPTVTTKSIYGLYSAVLFYPISTTKINATNIHTAFEFDIIRKPTADNLDVSVISTMTSNTNSYDATVNTIVGAVIQFNDIKDNYGVVRHGKGIQFRSGTAGVTIPAGTKIELFGVKY